MTPEFVPRGGRRAGTRGLPVATCAVDAGHTVVELGVDEARERLAAGVPKIEGVPRGQLVTADAVEHQ